jgi:hypothetical protein
MQKEEMKVELTINNHKVIIGHRFLEEIAYAIPDVRDNIIIFSILARSNSYRIKESLSQKKLLSTETINSLLNEKSDEIINNILSNRYINKYITDEQIFPIIEKNNIKSLSTIGKNLNELQSCDRSKIINLLSKHKSSSVRHSLFGHHASYLISTDILKELCDDEDFDVAYVAKKELSNRLK